MSESIGIGVVGLGFMGKTHIEAWKSAQADGLPCHLAAVCDQDPERRSGKIAVEGNIGPQSGEGLLFDPDEIATYEDPQDLFTDDNVRIVSICTHTESHAPLAIQALQAGKHVLVEKPLATDSDGADRVLSAAESAVTLCMPAMCMRFWPGWNWLNECIREETYGRVRSATFQRLASPPGWSKGFYTDSMRTGGALFDLHIHDADFIRWCFGEPTEVRSTGSIDHVTTFYQFADGPGHVVAEGGWDHTPGWEFKMRYVVIFEEATADFDLTREHPLILSRDGSSEPVELADSTGYDGEVRHLLEAVVEGRTDLAATAADAAAITRVLEAERRSLETTAPFKP